MGGEGDNCRIYIGNLPEDIRAQEVVDLLAKYGRVRDVDIKAGRTRNGTAFAFVEFDHPSSAEDAVERCDNMPFGGNRLRVEFTGQRKPKRGGGPYAGSGPPVRSEYRVIVLGLPKQVSWQDLKDHMRAAGNVGYAVIDDEHRGIVEYEDERGQMRALERLHRSEFRNPFARAIIKVYTEDQLEGRGRSVSPRRRSPSPRRSSRRYDSDRKRGRSPVEARGEDSGKRRRYGDDDNQSDSMTPSGRRRSPGGGSGGGNRSPRARSPALRGRSQSPPPSHEHNRGGRRSRSPSPRYSPGRRSNHEDDEIVHRQPEELPPSSSGGSGVSPPTKRSPSNDNIRDRDRSRSPRRSPEPSGSWSSQGRQD